MEQKKVGIWIKNTSNLQSILLDLFSHPNKLKEMKKNASLLGHPNATKEICEVLAQSLYKDEKKEDLER